MLNIKVIGTGSSGNCYVLEVGVDSLIIECGSVQFLKLKKSLNYDFSRVRGALISHSHKDHCGDVKKILQCGIHTLGTAEVFNGCEQYSAFCHTAKHLRGVKFGQFRVLPLAMRHDIECFGYLISIADTTLLFATDTTDIPYSLPQVDYLMIESNYSRKIIDEKLFEGSLTNYLHHRIIRSHMSLETAIFFILGQKRLKGILLIHLSADNARKEEFQQLVAEKSGVLTYVATNGISYEFI